MSKLYRSEYGIKVVEYNRDHCGQHLAMIVPRRISTELQTHGRETVKQFTRRCVLTFAQQCGGRIRVLSGRNVRVLVGVQIFGDW